MMGRQVSQGALFTGSGSTIMCLLTTCSGVLTDSLISRELTLRLTALGRAHDLGTHINVPLGADTA